MIREFQEALALINLGMAKSFTTNYTPEIEMQLKPYDFHGVMKEVYNELQPIMIKVPGVSNNNSDSFKITLPTGNIIIKMQKEQPRFEFGKWKPL